MAQLESRPTLSERRSFILVLALGGALAAALSCSDPSPDMDVSRQGNETATIPQGEFHRAGEKCTACHIEGGPASDNAFTVAGTIFASPTREVGVDGAEVRMTDSQGTKFIAKTNCVGNFFVTASDWNPSFPILVEIAKNNTTRAMDSVIGRERSCAGCHSFDLTPDDPLSQVNHIYLFGGDETGSPNGASDCAVTPIRPGTQ
jgi:hypothetical protein